MSDNPEFVTVPFTELEKLEEARIKLYRYLETIVDLEDIHTQIKIQGLMTQIWKVANTKLYKRDVKETEETEELDVCPDCYNHSVRAKGIYAGGGVECITPGCDYWFCF